jgi:serine/threonine protein kinase
MHDIFGLIGTTIDGLFRVDRLVGEGGFGIVYQGFHLAFEHEVAVKCLKVPAHFTPESPKKWRSPLPASSNHAQLRWGRPCMAVRDRRGRFAWCPPRSGTPWACLRTARHRRAYR